MNAAPFSERFLGFLARHAGGEIPPAQRGIIRDLCERALAHHTCLPLDGYAEADRAALEALPVCGPPGSEAPLIVSAGRLFLHRHYLMEREVAASVTSRNQPASRTPPGPALHKRLNSLFGGPPRGALDLQRLAVFQAATRQLAIITGGPGTGKTYVVAKLMALLAALEPSGSIRLAAPTGKAAMRLMESLGAGQPQLEALTLHRLLGVRRDGRSFRHHRDNPIAVETLIIDEASMVDLVMMHRVLEALPDQARLILLGDPDQLPSVETGNVLGDLCMEAPSYSAGFCQAAEPSVGRLEPRGRPSRLTDALTALQKNYRFAESSAIGRLAAAVKAGEASLEAAGADPAIEVQPASALTEANCAERLLPHWQDYLARLGKPGQASAAALLAAFDQCRILCSHRQGFPGVEAINQAIERRLESQGHKAPGARYFHGQPILVTQNDYNLRLFNGDLGICARHEDGWQVAFPFPGGELRHFLASRLPAHETCYAMTVHKSQGSEFDRAILVLPEGASREAGELLTRELVYTAITRCRRSLAIYASQEDWQGAMGRSAIRASGMSEFL